ncbi:methyl-accepting chemotaxis protein [Paucibacter sp. DJ1R-11]|uniref:methyl-accepting chemotaxis protein n=1 Tax=Paucibacter sp. DJ1R-11 TaxID=2893556 RepID=UPI0021E3AA6F|nr:methyl-accepting chemotaxis protein [Paucibacter sp. DJ1R-11]MCV2362169.1 methyl-accepting chemotaxis protein [Paucibacter sp. DJ1R-11]
MRPQTSSQTDSVPSTPAWARPGVNWFRKMMFPAKAAVILLLLVLPLLLTLAALISDRQSARESTAAERTGLAAIQAILPAMEATQLLRRGLVDRANGVERSDLPALQDKFKQAIELLHKETKPRLDGFADKGDEHWKPLMAVVDSVTRQSSQGLSAAEVRKPYVEISGHLGDLVKHVVDASGLALDPEGDSYYMMMAATIHLPQLMENLGLTRGALASYVQDPKSQRLATAAASLAVDKAELANLSEGLAHAMEFNPALAKLKLEEKMAGAQAFVTRYEAMLQQDEVSDRKPGDIVQEATAVLVELSAMQKTIAKQLDQLLEARQQRLFHAIVYGASSALALLLAGLYFFYCFYRVMNSGIRTLILRMRAMAGGDLTDTLTPKGSDETAMLMGALAEMQQSLRATVREVREAADVIKLSADEVATGSMDLSQRTEQAAANLEETASAMEEISSTVSNTTDGAAQAAGVAAQNVKLADQGGQVIEQVVTTMSEIQDSSRRIGEIIGVIDSIAFQTNILALNAAVEAARAGEQGRGFAVVASEVRALAQRSAEAAREIKQLIVASGERVEVGNRIVSEAGTTMRAIVESTSKVGSLLQGISSGAREQAQGIDQVGKAIHELDQMTQQNAALVEETAAASSGMRQQADQLARAVNTFKLP